MYYNDKKFIILLTTPFDEIKNYIVDFHQQYKWENIKQLFENIYEDILNIDDWFRHYTMTQEQNNQWQEACIRIIMRERHLPKYRAKKQMLWINLQYGLKVSDYEKI